MSTTRPHIRDLGYGPGYFDPGAKNSILDIPGLAVGQKTIHDVEKGIHVGVTLVFPRGVTETRTQPSYAAIHTLNGGGEMTGTHFIKEWGFTGSPIAFTDSMSCGAVYQALTNYSFQLSRSLGEEAEAMYSHHGWPVVGETWGGGNTDIHDFKSTLKHEEVVEAVKDAETRRVVLEGSHGGGSAMLCLGHKGGTGTSSRVVPIAGSDENYTVGVLLQTNFGNKHMLNIGGVPVGKLLLRDELAGGKPATADFADRSERTGSEGSIVICVVTDAPLLPHQLARLAARTGHGIVSAGGHGVGYNSSGDIAIALSTSKTCAPQVLMRHEWERPDMQTASSIGGRVEETHGKRSGGGFRRAVEVQSVETVVHNSIDALFVAAAEATEEAILNSLCQAEDFVAHDGTVHKGLDTDKVKELLEKYRVDF